MTGKPVLLLTRDAAIRILSEQQRFVPRELKQDNAAELVQQAQRRGLTGWRLVSFHSVGGGGLLPCFHPDAVSKKICVCFPPQQMEICSPRGRLLFA